MALDRQLLEKLICPWHSLPLSEKGSSLHCQAGHEFPVVEDVPVILSDGPQTLWVAESSRRAAVEHATRAPKETYYIDTIGISEEERRELHQLLQHPSQGVDPIVAFLVAATNGIAYKHLLGSLPKYPIPELRLPPAKGETFLEVGCSWGRWCVAAGHLGYRAIGVDPSLGAVLAGKRVAAQLGVAANFVVADARFLPFRSRSIDVVFSYSVLQHFGREDAADAIQQIGTVLARGGKSMIQMPTVLGIRCLYHQARRGFREPRDFDVRYWSIPALNRILSQRIGPTTFSVDCFFGIGLQASDMKLMPRGTQVALHFSEFLRKVSRGFPGLVYMADSVYAESTAARA